MQRAQIASGQKSWTRTDTFFLIAGLIGLFPAIYPSTVFAYGPPLVEAASKNDLATVQGLLRQGEDPNLAGFDGTTALMHATRHHNVNMIRSLLEKGADLQIATLDGNLLVGPAIADPTIVSLLLDYGLQVNTSATNGQTLLMTASRNGATQAAQLLLSRGADIHAQDKTGMNALHHAIAGNGSKATVAHLLNSGAQVNHAKADGTTAIMEAARKGRADFVEILIQNGADVNAKNSRRNGINYCRTNGPYLRYSWFAISWSECFCETER
jgi:ankyrin repeat protein